MELSGQFPVRLLCKRIGIPRSSFYLWKKSVEHPSQQKKRLVQSVALFQEYHNRFPSHGYRWLNAKIKLDKGILFSDPYAHKCCKIAGIKSVSKHYRYKKPGDPFRTYPNLLLAGVCITGPMECVVSDMTAFYVKGTYYELTLYMDLWNDELIAHALSSRRGDRMTYLDGLQDVLAFKKQYPEQKLILHSDQGSVYASKSYNELLPMYNIQGQCPEPVHQPTMLLWSPSTAGSRPNSLRISILPHRRTFRNRYPITFASLTKNARRTRLDTLRRSSIGNGLRPSENMLPRPSQVMFDKVAIGILSIISSMDLYDIQGRMNNF